MSPALDLHALALEPLGGGVASLRIATEGDPHLSFELAQLDAVAERVRGDEAIRVVIVEGAGGYFSAGGTRDRLLSPTAPTDVADFVCGMPAAVAGIPVPTIAAMAGHAIGGGMLTGLWCDLALLAEESLYGANFVDLGFTCGMGASALLEEFFGPPLAREMLLTGRLLKGRELRAAGVPIAHAVLPRAEVRPRALALARQIADAPRATLLELKALLAGRRLAAAAPVLAREREALRRTLAGAQEAGRLATRYGAPGVAADA